MFDYFTDPNGNVWMDMLDVAIRATASIIVLFLLAKLLGNKQIKQLNFFDYVVGISIGSIAAEMATIHGFLQKYTVFCNNTRFFATIHGFLQQYTVFCNNTRFFATIHGFLQQYTVFLQQKTTLQFCKVVFVSKTYLFTSDAETGFVASGAETASSG